MILTFTSARSQLENDPGLLFTPGCLCIITVSKLTKKKSVINKQKDHKWFDFHVSKNLVLMPVAFAQFD